MTSQPFFIQHPLQASLSRPARVPKKTRRKISKDILPVSSYTQPTPSSPPNPMKNATQYKPLVSESSEDKGLVSKQKAERGPGPEDETQASMFMRACKNSISELKEPHTSVAPILESKEGTAPVSESELVKPSVPESKQDGELDTEPEPEPKQDGARVSKPKPEANRETQQKREDALGALALGRQRITNLSYAILTDCPLLVCLPTHLPKRI